MESALLPWVAWYSVIFYAGWKVTKAAILSSRELFIKAGLKGNDMGRAERPEVAESLGLISAVVFLVLTVLSLLLSGIEDLAVNCGALLTITSAAFLGFIDDVLEVKWRHKLWAPAVSTLPLISVYIATKGPTSVLLPGFARGLEFSPFGLEILTPEGMLHLGPVYYVYLAVLIIFCLNSINILAGVNGLEAGQSFVIGAGFIVYNLLELASDSTLPEHKLNHEKSLALMIPFCACVLGLLQCNWYPAKVFVGDTFCYWAGCTLAVTAIVGRFTKTGMLFFIPQLINFVYGLPQLFQIIPCPRHRLPRFDSKTGLRTMSTAKFKFSSLHPLGQLWVRVGTTLGLIWSRECDDGMMEINNLTNLNLTLKFTGPISERNLTVVLLLEQVLGCFLALAIRYQLSHLLY